MENLEILENKIDELKALKTLSIDKNIAILSAYNASLKQDLNAIVQSTIKELAIKRIRLLKKVNGWRTIFYQEVFEDEKGNIIKYGDVMVSGGDINRSGSGRGVASFGFSRVGIPEGIEIIDLIGGHGSYFAQVKDSNTMWVWGYNAQGCLGLSHTNYVTIPQKVTFPSKIKKIVSQSYDGSNQFTFVLLEDGSLFGSGYNPDGQLGIGNNINSSSFVRTSLSNVKDVFVGNNFGSGVFAIKNDGKLYAWGFNIRGWLGLGHSNSVNTPTLVSNVENPKFIYHSSYNDGSWWGNAFIITKDGDLLGAGYNGQYNLSQSDTNQRNTFVPILNENNLPLKNIVDFKGGGVYDVALALDDKGNLYSWGCAEMGLGDNRSENSRAKIIAKNVKQIEKQGYRYPSNYILYKDGSMESFGYNATQSLGIGNAISPIKSLTKVILPAKIIDFHLCANYEAERAFIATDGNNLYACGTSYEGNLNFTTNILQPQIIK
ncbi:hypothetical protein BKH42_06865 [Helicobacter sp. 13S00482-2]|uniref:RCC1 domain-containing protein n=1 Tax=Helicobacter sp. 13S00482-2 TaxID=1476200 RepID=UPI000BA69ED8|nr:RCC1 domain-containing protein [Helicobacter sp. 13S00482-2]PAF53243.1 hypothetical protein BKH42_06865 [Helicobacter sp. 13S00482-2]